MSGGREAPRDWVADSSAPGGFVYRRRVAADALADMLSPVKCTSCGHVFDEASVPSEGRYTDCDVYSCPNCHRRGDNRPVGWGGSFARVDKDTGRTQ